MKLRASRIERMLAKVEATLAPPQREWLRVIIDDEDDEAKAKALAEHVTRHPEDVGRTVEVFNWILRMIVRPAA
jgi:predicted transcriptional regulator